MKFDTFIYEIVKNYQQIFRKDPCIHTRTRGVNVSAYVLSQRNERVHVYASCGHVCGRIFTKNLLILLYFPININLKFHKNRSFRCGDICKTIMNKKISSIFNIFWIFTQFCSPKSLQRWIITQWLWNFLETRYQNVPI